MAKPPQKIKNQLESFLQRPFKVLIWCLVIAGMSLLFNGSLKRFYGLLRDRDRIESQIKTAQSQIAQLNLQLKWAKDPVFIEKNALDNLDLVDENDIVFVFSDE